MAKTFPVIEVFGPTIQGEGTLAGLATFFVRFGGCDYRCEWCDSLYAVLPAEVRANAVKMTSGEIIDAVDALTDGPTARWVTLSGGNPAMLNLGELVQDFQDEGIDVAVETQGSKWRDWLNEVDCLTVSPKPPSSGMAAKTERDLPVFMRAYGTPCSTDALKIVVFDDADLEWARNVFRAYSDWPAFLSCGTDPPKPDETKEETLARIGDRYAWLCEHVAVDRDLSHVRVLPQLHVLAWGHSRGV